MIKKPVSLLVLFSLPLLSFHCAGITPKPYVASRIPIVRVLLVQLPEIQVQAKSSLDLSAEDGTHLSIRENDLLRFQIGEGDSDMNVYWRNKKLPVSSASFILRDRTRGGEFQIQGKRYSGALHLIRHLNQVLAVNIVDVESYVKGVVPVEMGHLGRREMAALRAQAVAARTWALKKSLRNREQDRAYDLSAKTADQVYTGLEERYRWSDLAVESTVGEVITYHDSLIYAFYHSTCGGRTEFVRNVFSRMDQPYLRGVADNFGDSDFCSGSPDYRWVESYTFDDIDAMLRKFFGQNGNGTVTDILVTKRYQSGRVKELVLYSGAGNLPLPISGNRIRQAFPRRNGSMLRSTLFKVARYGPKENPLGFMLIGAGNGHGVGMCQWGAIGMAHQGYDYRQILQHYYRGTHVRKLY